MDSPLLARLGQAFRKRREALGVDAHLKLTRAARLKLTHPL